MIRTELFTMTATDTFKRIYKRGELAGTFRPDAQTRSRDRVKMGAKKNQDNRKDLIFPEAIFCMLSALKTFYYFLRYY